MGGKRTLRDRMVLRQEYQPLRQPRAIETVWPTYPVSGDFPRMRDKTRIDGESIVGRLDTAQELKGVIGCGDITSHLFVVGGNAPLLEKKRAAAFLAVQVDKAKNRDRVCVRTALRGAKFVRMHIYHSEISV